MKQFCSMFVRQAKGKVLIVGSAIKPGREDRRKQHKDAVGVDLEPGEGVDIVHDMVEPLPAELQGAFGHAECTSVIEHCKKPWKLAENLESALRIGGTILVSAPFVWREHAYPADYYRFTAAGIKELFPRIEWHELIYIGAATSRRANAALAGFRRGGTGHPFLGRCEIYGFGTRIS
jgi:hypothetical protein